MGKNSANSIELKSILHNKQWCKDTHLLVQLHLIVYILFSLKTTTKHLQKSINLNIFPTKVKIK